MTKSEFISAVAERSGFSKKETDTLIKAMTDVLTDALVNHDSVRFVGLGTFDTKIRSERQGINPQTQEKITIPAKRVTTFKTSKTLIQAIHEADNKPKKGGKKKKK